MIEKHQPESSPEISQEVEEESPSYVVGIGASAGGLEALERFFAATPVDTGMAYVIVQHLSPDFKSLMNELLGRHTTMPIHRVEQGMKLSPNSVYLIPPRKNMEIDDGHLTLTEQNRGGLNLPIDVFFNSLAEAASDRSIAIVMSGTGSDGSQGVRAIHRKGGLVVVQEPSSAAFETMPRTAISSNGGDILICLPEEMPANIVQYANNPQRFRQSLITPTPTTHTEQAVDIFRLFRSKFGTDFSLYKPSTILRRIERRMKLSRCRDLSEYSQLLQDDENELDALYRDFLVDVTHFFRDGEAFEHLRTEVIPNTISGTATGEEIRVWVAGCGTGEEAYSIAMLLHEAISREQRELSFKIFATDLHRSSIEHASTGYYSATDVERVPKEFLDNYFVKVDDHFRVTSELRQCVVFAPHDLTADPPFTKIDLLSCRNVLIYLNSETQQRVLSVFHFSLKTGGCLFLGPSESIGSLSREFESLDVHWRIYKKIRDVRVPQTGPRHNLLSLPRATHPSSQVAPAAKKKAGGEDSWLYPSIYEHLLGKYVPPSLLIDENQDLVHIFGDASDYVTQPVGRTTLNVLKLVDGNLRIALSAGLHHAKRKKTAVLYNGINVTIKDETQKIRVSVEPYELSQSQMYLICLEPIQEPNRLEDDGTVEASPYDHDAQAAERIANLERELEYTRESLQTAVEELESSNEELQSTNEELLASNEELQSTNEELHSVNEELYSVNAEHQRKIEELTATTEDLNNFLSSTDIGTIILDHQLRIRRFTPAITSAFRVIRQDIGRPIHDIAFRLDNPSLIDDLDKVLQKGTTIEREVSADGEQFYLQRVRPYQSSSGEVDGVVLTYDDITMVRLASMKAQVATQELALTQRELQEFAYSVSHDLQAPLRSISHATKNLLSNSELDPETQTQLERISESGIKLNEMMQGVLSYARVFSRGEKFTPVNLEQTLQTALSELRHQISASKAQVKYEELPTVLCDAKQMATVFAELLQNALKFADEKRHLDIRIRTRNTEDFWEISVSDNGIGIATNRIPEIFLIFNRGDAQSSVPGLGIGLALVHRIVERHGGRLRATSEVNAGTTIILELPK